ncbi:MAG TPA: GntR family transcriptional regulator [Burkholderiaceae bacterium]|nr:GntR family transcriptional regulator [Burkholderiaceae bacterium]
MSAPSFKIEAPKSLATLVAQRLRDAIIDGQFTLGAMIPEETLAASFGVSRTPVREALNQLQLLGLVTIRPQRGSYVFEASEADVAALCEFRCVMEPRAAELAWHHDREATLADLKTAVADMSAARKQKDGVRYSRADTRLHEAFVQHCGNPYLQAAYATAGARIAALRTHLSAPADVLNGRGHDQHKRMTEYFAAGDFKAFEALMREHVMGTRDNYVASLKARRAATGSPPQRVDDLSR